jgi:hypothetical protein
MTLLRSETFLFCDNQLIAKFCLTYSLSTTATACPWINDIVLNERQYLSNKNMYFSLDLVVLIIRLYFISIFTAH